MKNATRIAILLLFMLNLFIVPALPAAAQSGRTFPETGKTINGRFQSYWQDHGGLAQQGYPISDVIDEVSPADGKTYKVQYFERAVFETHPDNKAPNDVLLSLLGNFLYKQKYPSGAPGQAANTSANAKLFKETGKTVGGRFLQYWEQNGGLAQQGYPISEEFQEKSELDDKTYTVQYFERAVFEYHPENSAPNDVLLSQLGKYRLDRIAKPGGRLLNTFEQVWWLVKDQYVYTDYRGLDWNAIHDEYSAKIAATTADKDAYTLITDMVTSLNDRHSGFQTPELRAEDDALRNGDLKLSGIGVTMQDFDGARRISYVVPGGPADRAGLRVFDVIRAVDGESTADNPDVYANVRGPEGEPVTLTIESPGKAPRDVVIVRESVTFSYHATVSRLPGTNIAYVNLPTFNSFGIAQEVEDKLTALAADGPLTGAIIDVRLNGGGLIAEMLDTVKLFVDGGIGGLSATRKTREPENIPTGQTVAGLRGKPVIVLVSNVCESACEHFSVAMHDLKRATILGTSTAGNTETLWPHDLIDGSRLFLAQATFLRPDGTSIEDKGLTPDVVLDVPWYTYSLGDDPQVKAAIDLVAKK